MGSQCTFDKKARLRQIKQDIDGLQAKSKQSSNHVPAGMTYAEVFSAAINAAMRHKRAMVGNLSRKSDDSPTEVTFEEIEAYERVTQDYVPPSEWTSKSAKEYVHLPNGLAPKMDILHLPQHGLARSTGSRFQTPPSRESGLGAGREGAEGRNHMRRQCSITPSALMSDTFPPSVSARGTPLSSLGRIPRQSSTNLSSWGIHGPDASPDHAFSAHKPQPQEGAPPSAKQRGGSAGGFVKPTLPPAVVKNGFEANEQQQQQQQQQRSTLKDGERGMGDGPQPCAAPTAGSPPSPLHAQHSRLLLSQEGPRDSAGEGWGRQGGLGAMAWTSECMSPGSKRRADLALLELWRLDIADKEHSFLSRPYTAPSIVRGGKRYSSRSPPPLHGPDGASHPPRASPPRGTAGLRPATAVPVPHSMRHGSHPQPPGLSEAAHPRGESPQAHQRSSQQGLHTAWADGERGSAGGSRVQTPAVEAAASGQPGAGSTSGGTGDPRTWPFATHAAQGHQGMGAVDVILEEAAEGEEEEEGGEGEGGREHEDLAHERQKPGFYHIMRRAPHHMTTATMPYLMGYPLEELASMEPVPCLADVVAQQIWHPPRQALNPAGHQQLCEQGIMDKSIHPSGLMTQQQQVQRQRQLAQQHYTLWQQEQEREGLRMARRGRQPQEQTQEQDVNEGMHRQQLQQQQGVNASKLQPGTSSKSFQDRQERLQAARARKQSRDDKLRQGIRLHNPKTPPNLPLLSNQLQSPPRSPPVKQIEVLNSLRRYPHKATPALEDREGTGMYFQEERIAQED